MCLVYKDINLDLLKIVAEVNNLLDKLVYLRKDEKGYYIEYAFEEGAPHDNRCLSWYVKGYTEYNKTIHLSKEINKIYFLNNFTCGYEETTNECMVGKPKKGCNYPPDWNYKNPKKCACWDLELLENKLDKLSISFQNISKLLTISKK